MKKQIRNYLRLLNEIINIQSPFDTEILGIIDYDKPYPFLGLHSHSKLAKHNVVINAGVHGNEIIGMRILLRFIYDFNRELLGYYNFTIFPCVNPYGYTYAKRGNGKNHYVNDGFVKGTEDALTPESKLIKEALPQKIDLFIDVHADAGKYGFYIYERKRPKLKSLAEKSLKELKKHKIPIEESLTIYREKCINGVIVTPEKDGSMDDAMFKKGAIYSLCIELPGKASEDNQMVGSLLLLNTLLKDFKEIVRW